MTTKNCILVWWISKVCLNQKETTTCRCLEKLSSEFTGWVWVFHKFSRNPLVPIWVTGLLCPQDSAGFGLPCWYGRWKGRGESQEDQAAQNVRGEKKLLEDAETFFVHTSLFSSRYVMTNGYKPAPLDLSHVKLTPNQNQLVEKLAENGHNVWARDRVRQGWTYSIVQVVMLSIPHIQMIYSQTRALSKSHSNFMFFCFKSFSELFKLWLCCF